MKKKKTIILVIVILIAFILISITIQKKNSSNNNSLKNEAQIVNEDIVKANNTVIENNQDTIENKIQNELKVENNKIDIDSNIKESSLPNDNGLTINGVPKKFNQDIMAQANIAYLLGCDEIQDTTDFDKYISNHLPNNGIYISERTTYQKNNNPYDYVKERKTIMQEMLSLINLKYNIDKNNYLIINNNISEELEKRLNKIINGNKKIIIGFLPEYFTYIDDSEYGLQLGGGFMNSSYISLKPYNNIYTYIFNENSANTDDFFSMINEISQIDN